MSAPAARVRTLCASLLLCSLAPPAAAQAAAMGKDEAPIRWVDGRPMLKATLRAGDKLYYCNLLLDLQTDEPLFLHANAAGSLRSDHCDVEIGGIELEGLGFSASRDPWLEGMTATFANELQQVPVAGILGLRAFGAKDLRIDGPKGLLQLRAQDSGAEVPPSTQTLGVVDLTSDTGRSPRFTLTLPGRVEAKVSLATREAASWIEPGLARKAGQPDGVLASATAAPYLDFAKYAPFRPEVPEQGGGQGGIGGKVLQQMVLTLQTKANRLLFEHAGAPEYDEVEAALYRARYGDLGTEALTKFLQAHGEAPQAKEAAALLLDRLKEQGGAPAAMQVAGLAAIGAAPANGKGTAALEVLEGIGRDAELLPVRKAIADAGLEKARDDEDGNAVHKLRLELGQLAMRAGDQKEARRHLLAAVFGMPTSGAANFALGRWHEQEGQLEQAMARYFLTMLDMKNSGQEGFAAFAKVFRQQRGEQADLLAELQDRADGRVPAWQPIPREPGSYTKTGRTVLVELFTGAMCPPCVAADVACDALDELFDDDEVVLLQWHLPVPAPEPLVAQPSLDRAQQYGIGGTPTVIVAGGERVVGGGKADAIAEVFDKYRPLVEAELKQAPQLALRGEATLDGEVVRWSFAAEAKEGTRLQPLRLHALLTEDLVAFPGKNGILFHHHVVRAQLTAKEGVALDQAAMPQQGELRLGTVEGQLERVVAGFETQRPFLVRPLAPDRQRLSVVAFVVDKQSGKVLQAVQARVQPAVDR